MGPELREAAGSGRKGRGNLPEDVRRDISSGQESLFGDEADREIARQSALDRDKLSGERLTAQFRAPLTREEQLKKLKRAEPLPQTSFFEQTPEKPQRGLFGSERGGIAPDILGVTGAKKFIDEDVVPAAKSLAAAWHEGKDGIQKIVAPTLRGESAMLTGLNMRQRMAQFTRRYDQGFARVKDARAFFNAWPAEDNFPFIDNIEHGRSQGDANLDAIARTFRNMVDQRRREVQALGEGALEKFYTNYFPHIFENRRRRQKYLTRSSRTGRSRGRSRF